MPLELSTVGSGQYYCFPFSLLHSVVDTEKMKIILHCFMRKTSAKKQRCLINTG